MWFLFENRNGYFIQSHFYDKFKYLYGKLCVKLEITQLEYGKFDNKCSW